MIISIAGLSNGPGNYGDLSVVMDREQEASIEATIGNRMDVLHMTLMDRIPPVFTLPDRGEIIIYDTPAGGAVTDPPNAISAYNTFRNGAGSEVTSPTPANWTPRLYGGYLAKPKYSVDGAQRYIDVTAQDYTYRLRTTIGNLAFPAGSTDQAVIASLFTKYRNDYDTSNVALVTANLPAISFPAHTLEQCLQRLIKVSRAYYRVDYYKRLYYGTLGMLAAPINFSDIPDFVTTFPTEGLEYEPDGTSLVNKVWVIGGTFLSNVQAYQIPTSAVQNSAYQFALPGDPEPGGMAVTVAGVDQGTIGVAPGDGDPTNQTTFKRNALVQHIPPILMLKTTPAAGATIIVTGKFRYPLIQTISDPTLIAATGGLIFEGVVRDRRINDLTLAQQVGKSYLAQQGQTVKGGGFLSKYRGSPSTGQLLQPGQNCTIRNATLFAGLLPGGVLTNPVVITKILTRLSDDINQPWEMSVSYADRHVGGGY